MNAATATITDSATPALSRPQTNETRLLWSAQCDDVDAAIEAARQLVTLDARRMIPLLVDGLEERFWTLRETGCFPRTTEGFNGCIALAIALEPLLRRTQDTHLLQRVDDLASQGMFNPLHL